MRPRAWSHSLARAACLALACLLAASVPLALAHANQKPNASTLEIEPIAIEARAVAAFDKLRSDRRRFGKLEWLGGLVLSAPSPHFGGWSGLAIDADGRRFVAVSDAGTWLTGEFTYKSGALAGIANGRIGPLLAQSTGALKRGRDRDAESLTLAGGTLAKGELLIAFERNHRIGRFDIDDRGVSAPLGYLRMPPEARRMRSNNGLEALAAIQAGPHKGATVAFAERYLDTSGHHTGWIWTKGEPKRLAVRDIGEFDLTAAAATPDGGLLLLERRFRWYEGVQMRLRRIAPAAITPGAPIDGDVLLEADMGFEIDNMEGMAVHRGRGGETIVTLISDDNFNSALQRTLVLQFALPQDGTERAARTR